MHGLKTLLRSKLEHRRPEIGTLDEHEDAISHAQRVRQDYATMVDGHHAESRQSQHEVDDPYGLDPGTLGGCYHMPSFDRDS